MPDFSWLDSAKPFHHCFTVCHVMPTPESLKSVAFLMVSEIDFCLIQFSMTLQITLLVHFHVIVRRFHIGKSGKFGFLISMFGFKS